ncbi:iron-sulfur cluster carrier protein [Elysia marginata]|uniref:Iron-sulfur cluster carrier protein n=1 Tax=Elysia marginata TaxID=1093978 RepID=A0AAV4GQ44_9GAST|nr:iron-sulfur cluster carrier protein [Elysia marginata]
MFSKSDVLKALSLITIPGEPNNMVDSGAVRNIVVFGDEVIVDVVISNPTIQAKKKTEVEILKIIHEKVYTKAKIKVNIDVHIPKPPKIKGKKIEGITNIIAVASGKGGVGKSTVASNLSVSLKKMGFEVGILDADIYGPSIPIMFDVEDKKPFAIKVDGVSKMKPIENYGVKILSIGFFTKKGEAVIWRGPMASKALKQMIFDANWGKLDVLILDLPPGTGDIHLSILQSMPVTGAVIVSTPQNVALADVSKAVAMFRQQAIDVPILGIIENMAYFTPKELPDNKYYIFGREGAKTLSKDMDIPFLGEIPIVQSVREAGDIGCPVAAHEDTPLQEIFQNITRNTVKQLALRNKELPPTEITKITTMAGCVAVKSS